MEAKIKQNHISLRAERGEKKPVNSEFYIQKKKKTNLEDDDEIKTFSNEERLRESIANRAAPKELLKEVIQTEGK